MWQRNAQRLRYCVTERLFERKHQRYALPYGDALLVLLGNGKLQWLFMRVRELHALPLAERVRNALC